MDRKYLQRFAKSTEEEENLQSTNFGNFFNPEGVRIEENCFSPTTQEESFNLFAPAIETVQENRVKRWSCKKVFVLIFFIYSK